MIRAVVTFTLLGAAWASVTHFTWSDCDSDPNRAIKISSVEVSPMPIVMPGPVTFSFNASLSKVMQGGTVELDLKRHVLILGNIHVPCLLGVGSCTYNYCTQLDSMLRSSDDATRKVGTQLKTILSDNHINADCPIPPQTASVSRATLQIPDPGSLASVIAAGDYTIKATIKDRNNNIQGCVSFKVELKRRSHGFLFG
ncbi:ganglioside GM2 activator-like [Liolophura sinensis]|uniref:ganglioside GM2 activator-like n=1 Tax=Liolophura sinensis TaxID=3198878 RepID=UPI003159822D